MFNTEFLVAKKFARQGSRAAQYDLGMVYYKRRKYAKAMRWFSQLASTDGDKSAEAIFMLGVMYSRGEGVPQDYVKAATWLMLNPNEESENELSVVKSHMTPSQISEAEAASDALAGRILRSAGWSIP